MPRGSWTDEQNDAIVADYFAMLEDDLRGVPYSKTHHRRALQRHVERSESSIEYKHRNISAILRDIGETWIQGYRPASNYQRSLEDAVVRWLNRNLHWSARAMIGVAGGNLIGAGEAPVLWVGPAPTQGNAPPPIDLERSKATARRFNVAERDERNRALGRAGEERVLIHERAVLHGSGRRDLAEAVRWVSEQEGDGLGYDIASFESDGRDRLIEVKTTNGWARTPFHISRNELAVADANRDAWCLLRLYNFAREPRAFEIRPPLERHVELTPTSFQASLR